MEVIDVDVYGRSIGEVFVGELHVNAEMVRRGHAWAYTRYVRGLEIVDLESEARAAGRGLWQLPEAQRDAPWQWRHSAKQSLPASRAPGCGAKRTCGEMADCSEARFYLTRCGLTRLDGDGDGTPCESLCRAP